jgi:Kef-type K+ transport system membrane component KefB
VKVVTRATQLARTVAVLDDVFGVFALALLAAWLRPESTAGWQLPGVGWLFVTLGMAATLGLVVHFSLLTAESTGERTSLLLGSVALTAGLAGAASISPLVVCFLAGVVLRNIPGGNKSAFEAAFTRLERPVYLLFLTIVGALWQIDDWRGWLLLVVFMLARLGGRYLGARAARRLPASHRPQSLDGTPDSELILAPMGQLAIALVVTAQALYDSPAIRATVTAVVGGSILTEVFARIGMARATSEAEPVDPPEAAPEPVLEGEAFPTSADDDSADGEEEDR